jgi:hypothetical protein
MRKEYDFSRGRRGAVAPAPRGKTRITIRLDDDVLAWFRERVEAAGGGNYQTLINEALRKFVNSEERPLEKVIRDILRDELSRVSPGRKSKKRRAA